jgi:DNA-binding NarL/FixJ family response regulator
MKALIIDNEDLFRLGIKNLLETQNQFESIIEVTTDRELLSLSVAETQQIRLTIMNPACFPDIPDAFWRPIQQICPASQIIAMGEANYEQFSYNGIKFIPRAVSAYDMAMLLQATINDIINAQDTIHVQEPNEQITATSTSNEVKPVMKNFSKRRLQILEMAAMGLSNKDIASQLNIAEGTVKAHMHLIMKMLNVTNRTQAALWYQNQFE